MNWLLTMLFPYYCCTASCAANLLVNPYVMLHFLPLLGLFHSIQCCCLMMVLSFVSNYSKQATLASIAGSRNKYFSNKNRGGRERVRERERWRWREEEGRNGWRGGKIGWTGWVGRRKNPVIQHAGVGISSDRRLDRLRMASMKDSRFCAVPVPVPAAA